MKYLSKIFQPLVVTPKNAVIKHQDVSSKSQKLMMDLGLVRPTSSPGCFALLPLCLRSLRKLTSLVERALQGAGAQPLALPLLASEDLWRRSGRLDGEELMKTSDRQGRAYVICPTHEEMITDLISSISPIGQKQLPLMLYQIGSKFRDEMRPRYGIIRCREFLMKDLYTFDKDEHSSKDTYELINGVYDKIFREIGLDFVKVEADSGTIGGTLSHEYHYLTSIGEDALIRCESCLRIASSEFKAGPCDCRPGKTAHRLLPAIEVGHTFLLGTRYSAPLNATLTSKEPLHMGCYGLGLTRILAASLEVMSSETELRWPQSFAPYSLCIIGPKEGSKEFAKANPLVEEMYALINLNCQHLHGDTVIDDRNSLTIGKRLMEAKRMGYPYIMVVGQKATGDIPEFELIDLTKDAIHILNKDGVVQKLCENVQTSLYHRNDLKMESVL